MNNKFRAWDKRNKQWSKDWLYIDDEGDLYEIEERSYAFEIYMYRENVNEDYDVSWFTGVRDKNGADIYEGDIVRGYDKHRSFNPSPITATVVWNRLQLAWRLDGVGTYTKKQASLRKLSDVEVIGNIYEHPELSNSPR